MRLRVAILGRALERMLPELEGAVDQLTVVRRCTELRELAAVCQSGLAEAAILSEQSEEVNTALLERLSSNQARLVVLSDDPLEVARLSGLGIQVFSLGSTAQHIIQGLGIEQAVPGLFSTASPLTDRSAERKGGSARPHRIIAVWGPIGSPGRTTIAVNMAAELAAQGRSVMLIDGDSYGPSIAATLAILDESAGIAQAARLADQGLLDRASLLKIAPEVALQTGTLRVLSGLTRPDRWPELRPLALRQLFELAKLLFEVTVIDCGFCLETDEEISADSYLPRRNAATLTALRAADQVVAVGAADSIGVPRLIRALQELSSICAAQQVAVFLNKVRREAAGRMPEQALTQAWARFGPQFPIQAFLPWEAELLDRMLLSGELLLEAGAESALRKKLLGAIRALAQHNEQSAVLSATARNL